MVELSKRLETIASFVKPGSRIADIGTDHGFLPIYLVQKGVIDRAVAMDIRKGPLARAQEHIQETGLGEKIETRLSDGLEKLNAGEADTVIIAGMGGPLVLEILHRGIDVVASIDRFVLSPQSDWNGFRKGLRKMGFVQCREEMVFEDGKYYLITEVQFCAKECRRETAVCDQKIFKKESEISLQELNDRFGPLLLVEKNQILRDYLEWQKGILEGILHKLTESKAAETGKREAEVKTELAFVDAALALL